MAKEKRFCPNCGSTNVEPDMSESTAFAEGNISDWQCNECNYSGIMPEGNPEQFERKEDSEDFPSDSIEFEIPEDDDHTHANTDYSVDELKTFLYIFLPLTIVYITYLLVIR